MSDYEVMLQLTDWLFDKYMFTSPAFFFLCIYLSNGRIRGMLKSRNLKDIRNATWDLCFLQEWNSLSKQNSQARWLVATRDRAIKEIARLMFIHGESEIHYSQKLESVFGNMWGAKNNHGRDLLERVRQFRLHLDDSQRGIVGTGPTYLLQLDREIDAEYNALANMC